MDDLIRCSRCGGELSPRGYNVYGGTRRFVCPRCEGKTMDENDNFEPGKCPECGHKWGHAWTCQTAQQHARETIIGDKELHPAGTRAELDALRDTLNRVYAERDNALDDAAELRNALEQAKIGKRDFAGYLDTVAKERDNALDLLAYFVCHMPAQATKDDLFNEMFERAIALTRLTPDNAPRAESE